MCAFREYPMEGEQPERGAAQGGALLSERRLNSVSYEKRILRSIRSQSSHMTQRAIQVGHRDAQDGRGNLPARQQTQRVTSTLAKAQSGGGLAGGASGGGSAVPLASKMSAQSHSAIKIRPYSQQTPLRTKKSTSVNQFSDKKGNSLSLQKVSVQSLELGGRAKIAV